LNLDGLGLESLSPALDGLNIKNMDLKNLNMPQIKMPSTNGSNNSGAVYNSPSSAVITKQ
jgi:hypothetical protein